ncbi:hypothetical protein CAJAP_04805 [Camponotus japonicus]
MFSQSLLLILLFCVFYCYTQEITVTQNEIKSTMSESMIISTAMACSLFSVLIVLVPTILYYRYCSKREIEVPIN